MPTIGNSIAIICIIIVFQLIIYYRQTQEALLWWHNRLWMRMCEKGEEIRNGLLQDSFVMRRYLELSSANINSDQRWPQKHYLNTFEKFYRSLNELSDYLFPAHIDDSLSLAIRHLLNSWKWRIQGLEIETDLQNHWYYESHQLNRIILMVLDELLRINLVQNFHVTSISIILQSNNKYSEIIVNFTNNSHILNKKSKIALTELKYLRHCFNFLTKGRCWYKIRDNQETWFFRWQCSGKMNPEET